MAAWSAATAASGLRVSRPAREPAAHGVRMPALLAAGALAAGAWVTSGGGEYTRTNVLLWLGAVVAWLAAWWPRSVRRARPPISRADAATLLALAAVVGVAAFFALHALDRVPAEPTSDRAEKLLDVRDVVGGRHPIFFPRNTGREPAQFYVSAALVEWAGRPLSWETLKLGTALLGLLVVPAIFLFGNELGGRAAGLAAAALAAVSKWPVGLDRMGLRFPYAVLASALVLWLLLRYLRRGDRRDALLCGLALAFGLHGYSTARVLLLAAAVVFLVAARSGRAHAAVGDGALALLTAFVASMPLARYAADHPDAFFARMSSRVEAPVGLDAVSELASNTLRALGAFTWRGDDGWTVSVVGEPFLDPLSGAALLAGAAIVVTIAVTRRSLEAVMLLVLGVVLLLPSTLNLAYPIENPSANRLGVAIPLVFGFAALPVAVLWRAAVSLANERRSIRRPLIAVVLASLAGALAVVAVDNHRSYFDDFRRQYLVKAANTSEVAAALSAERVPLERMFLLDYPWWLDSRNVANALGRYDWYLEHAIPPGEPVPSVARSGPLVFALSMADDVHRRELVRRYPGGRYRVVRSSVRGRDFALFVVRQG